MLLYIFQKLKHDYKDSHRATEAIESISRLMKVSADDLSAVRKLCNWPDEALGGLVSVLIKYEKYSTLDAYEQKSKGSMKSGMPLKVSKAMFRMIGKSSPQYIVENFDSVLQNKISLKTMLEGSQKFLSQEKTNTSLLQLSKFQDVEALDRQFPGKFTHAILEKYAGAQLSGKNKNVQGSLLESYYKSVTGVSGNGDVEPIVIEEYESLLDVRADMLEKNDIVVLQIKEWNQDYVQYIIDTAGVSIKDTFAVLILSSDGKEQLKVLSMVKDWEGKERFSVTQLFFEKDTSAKGKFGFEENIQFSVLLGKVQIHGESVPVLLEDQTSSLSVLLSKLCPSEGKVAVVTGPRAAVPFIQHNADSSWSCVTYYGDTVAVKKLKERFLKEKVGESGPLECDNPAEYLNDEKDNPSDEVEGGDAVSDRRNVDSIDPNSVYDFDDETSHHSLTKQSSTSKY